MNEASTEKKFYSYIEQTWTITEEQLNELKDQPQLSCIVSEEKYVVGIPETKYFLKLQIARESVDKNGFFLYLRFSRPKNSSKIRAKYSVFVKSENYSTQFDNIFYPEKITGWGDEICPVEKFFERNFIFNGKCIIEIKGILIFEEINEMPKIAMESAVLSRALWENDEKDFKIEVGNEENVMVHKLVLSTRSTYFEGMFRSGMKEAITNSVKIIDFNFKTVKTTIEFFYDRNIFESLNFDDAFDLLRFADKYQIIDLLDKLELHLIYQLSPLTVCKFTNGSIYSNSIKLRQICFGFLMICSKHSIPVENLQNLDNDFAADLFLKTFSPFD
uniref:BTB domain-containing protein n=1 Tax=Panagrolaimus sp. PS1159 TaxID=55785 RepID=A0AC35GW45_9BILA